MTTSELLNEVKTITKSNIDILQNHFAQLPENQIKWKPSEATWNVQEVFAHLNKFASYYHETFKKYIVKTRFTEPKENFLSSPLGRSAWKSMKLGNAKNVKRKFKTQRTLNPIFDKSLISGKDTLQLISNMEEFLQIIEMAAKVNIRKVKIPISISKIIRFRLGDALLYITYHNERHLQQALNLINHPKFPK